MPVVIQKAWYTRAQLRSQPSDLFAWGDNLARAGGRPDANGWSNPKAGQAAACRDEPNAVGLPTKRRPSMDADAFFTDADFDRAKAVFDPAFARLVEHLRAGGTVIWPADGIGTGRAKLAQCAPRIWSYLERCRERLFELGGAERI